MANNLEGGKTPQLPPAELQRLGFKLVAYPLSLLAVSLQAMQFAVNAIAEGRAPPDSAMSSFEVMPATAPYPESCMVRRHSDVHRHAAWRRPSKRQSGFRSTSPSLIATRNARRLGPVFPVHTLRSLQQAIGRRVSAVMLSLW